MVDIKEILKASLDDMTTDEDIKKYSEGEEDETEEEEEDFDEEEVVDSEDDVEDEEDSDEDEEEDDSEEDEEEEDEEEEDTKKKTKATGDEKFKKNTSKEDKAKYAYEQLRLENKKQQEELKRLDSIAVSYGFKNNAEMVAKLEADLIQKEAKDKGINPEFYAELRKTQRELEQLKQDQIKFREQEVLTKFMVDLDSFAKEYKLTSSEKEDLISKMDEDGVTVDTLSKMKNPKRLFKGYIEDKIVQRVEQTVIKKNKTKTELEETKIKGTSNSNDKKSMDELADYLVKQALSNS